MRTLLGFASLGAGLAFGAYMYAPNTGFKFDFLRPASSAASNAASSEAGNATTDIVVPKPVPAVRPAAAAGRTFSPDTPLFSPARGAVTAEAASPVRPAGEPLVTPAPSSIRVVDSARGMKPGDEDSRRELVRDLQRELKRVGCYSGEVHGSWTAASQRAMATFTERINATLPVKEPDGILLTLVRGSRPGVCGATCPAGQALDSEDKCVPKGVLAAAGSKTKVPEPKLAERARKTDGKAPAPVHVADGWATTVTPQTVPHPQAQQQTAAVLPPAPAAAHRPADLPGLMTIGGPKAEGDATAAATADSIAAPAPNAVALPPQAIEPANPGTTAVKKAKRDTPRPTVTASREAGTRHGTRTVQDIFTHPLGR